MPALYEYYNTGDDQACQINYNNVYWYAQTFTVGAVSHAIDSVKIKAYRVGSPGTLTVGIRAVDANGHPTGSDLTSGTINANTFVNTEPGAWYEIAMALYVLAANTKYAIVCRLMPPPGSGNRVYWREDGTSPTYAGGNLEESANGGSSWTGYAGYDAMFEVWGHLALTVTISEILGMSDSVARRADFKQTIAETLGMSDSAARQLAMRQTISEVLGMRDSAEARRHVGRLGDLPDHYREGGA